MDAIFNGFGALVGIALFLADTPFLPGPPKTSKTPSISTSSIARAIADARIGPEMRSGMDFTAVRPLNFHLKKKEVDSPFFSWISVDVQDFVGRFQIIFPRICWKPLNMYIHTYKSPIWKKKKRSKT